MKYRALTKGLAAALLPALSAGCFSAGSPPPEGDDAGRAAAEHAAAAPRCIVPDAADTLADQVLHLVNLERAAAEEELAPVSVNPALSKVAEDYACRMIEMDFFDHADPTTGHGPGERAVAGKYSYYSVGENLAAGATTAAEVMRLWMDSPPHRAIILDPKWKDVGIAIRFGSDSSIYWVQEFGDPAPQWAAVDDAHE